ncbi:hypothetical protein ANN_12537 [Periplaneta americana]|uniref:DUF4817 domain-containing protein n=1 Tax=Periplaneta americana TaxID=6978 RepID=A0ABQ8TIS2_PERAM|nr:hypothetical protein ANN_12537 [Periplaneta americana]
MMSLPSKETLRWHSDSSFRGEGYIQCCVGVRLCDMYSNQELAEIHFMYGKTDGNAALARRLYQERYPQRQCPDRKTFVHLHYRLCEYGKFNSPGLGRGRPRSTTPEVQEEILEAVNKTPSIRTRRVKLQVSVPHTTIWRLLKEYQLCGSPSTSWAGIIGDRLVGPHVLVNRLTGQAYTNFLENTIPHVLEDTPLINRQHIHLLHDGAPAHFSRTARRYLDRRFPDRWIGRGGPIAYPPCSPDLNPLDFYLWGHLKSLVYSSPVPDLESLRNRIVACSEDIRNTPGVWDRVRRSMRHRCENVLRELEQKKPQLDELVHTAENLKADSNRQQLHGKETAGSASVATGDRTPFHRKLPSIYSYWVEGKPRKKPQPGNLPRLGIEPGPPGFAARHADRYSTGVETRTILSRYANEEGFLCKDRNNLTVQYTNSKEIEYKNTFRELQDIVFFAKRRTFSSDPQEEFRYRRSAEDAHFDFLAAAHVTAYSRSQVFEAVHLLYCLI